MSLEHSLKLLKSCQTQKDYYCQMGNTTSWQTMLMEEMGKMDASHSNKDTEQMLQAC